MAEKLKEAPAAYQGDQAEQADEVRVQRPRRARLTEEEVLKRMETFDEREEQFVASVRKGKG